MTQPSKNTVRITCTILMLAIASAQSMGMPPINQLTINLEEPNISEKFKRPAEEGRTEPLFGKVLQTGNEERIWIFPRDPITPISALAATIRTSGSPDNADIVFTTVTEDLNALTTDISGTPSAKYLSMVTSSAVVGDIIPLTLPPTMPYLFAATIDAQVCAISMSPYSSESGVTVELFQIDDMNCANLPSAIDSPRLYNMVLRSGFAVLIYGQGASDGVFQLDLDEGISYLTTTYGNNWQPSGTRRMLDNTQGRDDWSVSVLIALYERPGSAFHGETMLGVTAGGKFQALLLSNLLDNTVAPTDIFDIQKSVSDMVQSSMFFNKIVCAHADDSDHIISIVDIEQGQVHHAIDRIDATANFIYHRGLVHPYGTSVYLFIIFGSATTPTTSSVHYLNYMVESLTTELEMVEIATGLTGDEFVTDMTFFPLQGYIAFTGIEVNSGSGVVSDLYFKAQIICHGSCATCTGLGDNECLSCPRGSELSLIGSGDVGTCELEEIEQNEVEANCGGVLIAKCIKCEEGFVGFCEICKAGAGLDKISERGDSGEFCIDCPTPNCKTCEFVSQGNLLLLTFFRKNMPRVL